LGQRRSTENLVVTNCLLATSCNAFKLGTESGGDFRNIAVSNCVISPLAGLRPPTSGIAILSVDGATIDGVAISNISMTGVRCPLFLRLGNRGRDMDTPTPGALRNVIISGIIANAATMPCALMGIPGHVIEGVTLKDLRLQFTGGSAPEQGRFDVPEQIAEYPDATKFANLPACSLYCRHASDIHFSGIRLSCQKPELRPAIVCDDVSGLVIESVEATAGRDSEALLSFRNVRDCLVRGCMPSDKTNVFLSVVGRESSGISLVANDFRRVKTPYKLGPDANLSPVLESANVR
jgi:hypothetical protein